MPPRRSCFVQALRAPFPLPSGFNATTAFLLLDLVMFQTAVLYEGFNATTAFLLLPLFFLMAAGVFRFNATTAFLLPGADRGRSGHPVGFQCHHGVPASRETIQGRWFSKLFQCHHGVPASRVRITLYLPVFRGFNATTAFLLPRRRFSMIFPSRVSMPPRRSCFALWEEEALPSFLVSMPPRRSCFRGPARFAEAPDTVSMPPRRSCFQWPTRVGKQVGYSFNATTAFLLPMKPMGRMRAMEMFQCHHGVPASGFRSWACCARAGFQCHHGVPASRRGERASRRRSMFQCHHGVPA